ncbi:unnamed protein product [Closterium sp. NIES-54]
MASLLVPDVLYTSLRSVRKHPSTFLSTNDTVAVAASHANPLPPTTSVSAPPLSVPVGGTKPLLRGQSGGLAETLSAPGLGEAQPTGGSGSVAGMAEAVGGKGRGNRGRGRGRWQVAKHDVRKRLNEMVTVEGVENAVSRMQKRQKRRDARNMQQISIIRGTGSSRFSDSHKGKQNHQESGDRRLIRERKPCSRTKQKQQRNTTAGYWVPSYVYDLSQANSSLLLLLPQCRGNMRGFTVNGTVADAITLPIRVECVDVDTVWRDTQTDIDSEVYAGHYQANPEQATNAYTAAFDFQDTGPTRYNPVIQYNSSYNNASIGGTPATLLRFARLLNLASNAFIKTFHSGDELNTASAPATAPATAPAPAAPAAEIPLLFVKDFPKVETTLGVDFVSLLGPLFYMWVLQLLLPVMTVALVYEKEQQLRIMMRMHGLKDEPYWLVSYLYFLLLSLAYIFFLVAFGSLIRKGDKQHTRTDFALHVPLPSHPLPVHVTLNPYGLFAAIPRASQHADRTRHARIHHFPFFPFSFSPFPLPPSPFPLPPSPFPPFPFPFPLLVHPELKSFTLNPYGLQLLLYIVQANTQIALAMLLSTAFAHTRPATVATYLYVFVSALLGQFFYRNLLESNSFSTTFMTSLQLFPAFALYHGVYELTQSSLIGSYQASQGTLTWATAATNGYLTAVAILAVEWLVFLLLAIYLDQVVSAGSGVRKHPLFFLRGCKSGCRKLLGSLRKVLQSCRLWGDARVHAAFQEGSWGKEEGKEWKAGAAGSGKAEWGEGEVAGVVVGTRQGTDVVGEKEKAKGCLDRFDVELEKCKVQHLLHASTAPDPSAHHSILCAGLTKVYPSRDGGAPKEAVASMWLGVARGECVGMLGPNGAGKTTALRMMMGFLQPSGGTAVIEGMGIAEEMDGIYSIMGVCPQHDLLWEQLTGRDHLLFYGRLKNQQGAALTAAEEASLSGVHLLREADKPVQQYSGGMKRRLSVIFNISYWRPSYPSPLPSFPFLPPSSPPPHYSLLWEQLTGREHLMFYGRLKNLRGSALTSAVEASLSGVHLLKEADKPVQQYSGGMKRRLSVAISLIGDPLVVYMDEPSTGLDPSSRMHLWNVVKRAKKHCAIVLTSECVRGIECVGE